MSIETEFQSTIQNVQNAYNGLNNLGATIPQNKTIENIKSCLDEIYDRLPKTEFEEGESVTLENTLKCKLDFQDGKVGFGQAKQETTQGYNLYYIDKNDYQQTWNNIDFTLTRTGYKVYSANSQASTGFTITSRKITLPAGTYTFVLKHTSALRVAISNTSYAVLGLVEIGSTYGSFSINQETDVTLTLLPANGASYNEENEIMLYSGNYDSSKTFEQYTGGYSSPSPNWKQQVKCVRGRNLFDSEIEIGAYNNNGINSPANNRLRSKTYTKVEPHTTYVLTWSTTKNAKVDVIEYTKNDYSTSQIQRVNNGYVASPLVFTTSNTTEYIRLYINSTGDSTTAITDISNIMLEEGTQATSYLPYNTIEEVVGGKNLYEMSNGTMSGSGVTAIRNNGLLSYSATQTTGTYLNASLAEPYKITPGTYTISIDNALDVTFQIRFQYTPSYNDGGTNVTISQGTTSKTFTLTDTYNYAYLILVFSNGVAISGSTHIQIEQGSSATTYEPYITPTSYQLSLGDIELNAIGNYKDELIYDVDEDKVYKNEKIGKVVLNGSESWVYSSGWSKTNTNVFYCGSFVPNALYVDNDGIYGKCNYFVATSRNFLKDEADTDGISYSGGLNFPQLTIRISKSIATDVNAFKSWLSSHNSDYYYILATPTLTELTDETLHAQVKALYNTHSNNGTTIITSNGNLPMIIKVRGLKGE